MKYETFDQPAYGVGDLETFGITDNSGSLLMDSSSDNGMESWRADSLLSEDLQAYTQVSRAHEMGGDGGTIPPPPPPPPGGSDDDDTSTDGSSSDTSGSGDAGSGDDVEEDTVIIEQGYDPTAELMQELMNSDSPDFVYQTEFGKLLEDYSNMLNPSAIASDQESMREDYWDAYQREWLLDTARGYDAADPEYDLGSKHDTDDDVYYKWTDSDGNGSLDEKKVHEAPKMDCSALPKGTGDQLGIDLPHGARNQKDSCTVSEKVKPADLMYIDNKPIPHIVIVSEVDNNGEASKIIEVSESLDGFVERDVPSQYLEEDHTYVNLFKTRMDNEEEATND